MEKYIIKSKEIYTEDGIVSGGLLVEDGKIKAIFQGDVEAADCPIIDYGENRLVNGFIETHNHGYLGWSAGGTEEDVRGYLKATAAAGVTGVLPTVGEGTMTSAANLMDKEYEGTRMLGIHCFGPFLNEAKLAGGVREYNTEVTRDMAAALYEESQGKMALMTLAPEIKGMKSVLDYLKEKGVKIAMGHTSATDEEAIWGIENGVESVCHICNMTSPIHHRNIGATGVGLMDDDIYVELICDLYHVGKRMLELIFRIKPKDRIMMITDNNPLSGMQPGVYQGGYDPNGTTTIGEDGLIRASTGRISGSSMCILDCIRHLVEELGMPLEVVLPMTGLTAATYLGLDDKKGSIKVGKDADLVVLSDDYKSLATYVEGTLCYTPDMRPGLINPDGRQPMDAWNKRIKK
ncbi:amidohydrolase family protein [Eubacteriales bacterium OttesenSCG-928-M02]|nr:amidohydrolase family protein [Eubacteriales bacterium OttesenSCG-928-M02]